MLLLLKIIYIKKYSIIYFICKENGDILKVSDYNKGEEVLVNFINDLVIIFVILF